MSSWPSLHIFPHFIVFVHVRAPGGQASRLIDIEEGAMEKYGCKLSLRKKGRATAAGLSAHITAMTTDIGGLSLLWEARPTNCQTMNHMRTHILPHFIVFVHVRAPGGQASRLIDIEEDAMEK
ncbi:hypothetical protein ARMSODRAFT_215944 [Armillaria solidipes]|uniref:Uncharacterized protein n=1 Tax=Armillaria solidipes TaxID=1076256 RepID=A0A2H3AGX0_9AGAR|nr:hypothetical protein ARMSODRAFT_215944 [Armillaria solidipes]